MVVDIMLVLALGIFIGLWIGRAILLKEIERRGESAYKTPMYVNGKFFYIINESFQEGTNESS